MNGDEEQRRLGELPDALTVEEARGVLRLGRNNVYQRIRSKEIPSVRIGRRLLIPREGIERLLRVEGGR